jgi:ferredoxin
VEKIVNLDKLIEALVKEYEVYAPVGDENFSQFSPIKKLSEANLDLINTTKPLKNLFLPQSEKIFSVDGAKGNITLESKKNIIGKRVILGAKACEVKGIELLTKVYTGGTLPDELFEERRRNTIVIGLSCLEPRDTCFCAALGVNPFEEKGMDLVLTKINGKSIMRSLTQKGEEFFKKYADVFNEISKEDLEKKDKLKESVSKKQNLTLDLKEIKEKLDKEVDNPLWEEIGARCITCGICTYLCPTCQCFDIHDEAGKGQALCRFRTWDSCMFPDFTLMAGGHNPRGKKKARIRQRFMHKFSYFIDNFSELGCTGCGRCIKFCPVNVDIIELIQKICGQK